VRNDDHPFLDRLVTADEKWVYYNNIGREKSWCLPGQAAPTVAKKNIGSQKIMLCVWWDVAGIIHYELLPPNQTVDADLYYAQLQRVHEKIRERRPYLANRKNVVFLHDNARPHTSGKTIKKMWELGWDVLDHPPYSPDIAPSDYHLFRKLQLSLQGTSFKKENDVRAALLNFFDTLPTDFFKSGIENLTNRWTKVVQSNGAYFD